MALAGNPRTPQDGQNVHGFQVRTPICHIVPVSRTYGYMRGSGSGSSSSSGSEPGGYAGFGFLFGFEFGFGSFLGGGVVRVRVEGGGGEFGFRLGFSQGSLCNVGASLHKFHVMMPSKNSPRCFVCNGIAHNKAFQVEFFEAQWITPNSSM